MGEIEVPRSVHDPREERVIAKYAQTFRNEHFKLKSSPSSNRRPKSVKVPRRGEREENPREGLEVARGDEVLEVAYELFEWKI